MIMRVQYIAIDYVDKNSGEWINEKKLCFKHAVEFALKGEDIETEVLAGKHIECEICN
jgi:hypothetical protein